MKILLVTPMPPREQAPGAIPLVLYGELKALARRHELSLLTVVGSEPAEQDAVDKLRAAGLDIYCAPLMRAPRTQRWRRRWRLVSMWFGGYPWRTAWFWTPEVQELLDRLQRERSFELIIVEDNAMGAYVYPKDAAVILTEHEVRRPRPANWLGWLKADWQQWPRRLFEEIDWARWPAYQKWVWRKFDLIQVFTNEDAAALVQLDPGVSPRVRVNPFGVSLPKAANPARENPHSVLFVGNFTHAPNVDAALWLCREIMPRLRVRSPGLKLTLVGIYPPREVQLLEADDIVVVGEVEDIGPYLDAAAVVLAPIRIGGGMRMKVLHAMAAAKPVVTTTRGAAGLSRQAGRPPVMIADASEDFVAMTADLLANVALRRELGLRAREYVSVHMSADAAARRLEGFASELVTSRVGHGVADLQSSRLSEVDR